MRARLAKRARTDIRKKERRETELVRIRKTRELTEDEQRELWRLRQHKATNDWYGYRSEMYRRYIFGRLWNKLYNIDVVNGKIEREEVKQEAYMLALRGKEYAKRWIREFDGWWNDGVGDKTPNAWRLKQHPAIG